MHSLILCLTLIICSACEPTQEPGTIIYLNGPSSSGKSTLAKALQDELDEPYLQRRSSRTN